jgi:hypothetical protein
MSMTLRKAQANAGVFISYRRGSGAGMAGRIADRLAAHFGEQQVFMDVDTISLGRDFRTAIEAALATCKAAIVIIDDTWFEADASGRRRLDSETDWVRTEVSAALRRDIAVIPILVGGVQMPEPSDFPEAIRDLSMRQGLRVSHIRHEFDADVDRLIRELERLGVRPQSGRAKREGRQDEVVGTAKVSGAYWLLPIFFWLLGGIIAYFAVRSRNPRRARAMLWVGIALTVLYVVASVASVSSSGGSSF